MAKVNRGVGSLLGAFVVIAFAVGGCGQAKDKDQQQINLQPKTIDEFIPSYVEELCSLNDRCPDTFEFDVNAGGDACRTQLLKEANSSADVRAPGVAFVADAAASCLTALRSISDCQNFYEFLPTLRTCSSAISGTLANGTACVYDTQCSSNYCDNSNQCPGVCHARAKLGESCESFPCEDATSCNASTLVCVPLAKDGDACEDVECVAGDACDPESRVCVAGGQVLFARKQGEACIDSFQCERGMYCDATRVCAPTVATGAACSLPGLGCKDGDECVFSGSGTSGICTTRPALGAACGDRPSCAAGDCLAGTCKFRGGIGDSCGVDDDCYSSYCSGGRCAATPDCHG